MLAASSASFRFSDSPRSDAGRTRTLSLVSARVMDGTPLIPATDPRAPPRGTDRAFRKPRANSPRPLQPMSLAPGKLDRAELARKSRHVVRGPLLADLAFVVDAIDVDRIPADRPVGSRDAEQVAPLRRRHDQAQDHKVCARDDVLLDRMQVRERPDEDAQQTCEIRGAAHSAQRATVPHDVRRDVLERAIGLVLVEDARKVFSGDPDLLLRATLVLAHGDFWHSAAHVGER